MKEMNNSALRPATTVGPDEENLEELLSFPKSRSFSPNFLKFRRK
jgi:hypothetical protein